MSIVTINVPKEVIFSLFDSESEFADYVKMTIAKDLYKNRNVSLEYCAAIVEMPEQVFAKCMEEITTCLLYEKGGLLPLQLRPIY